MMYVHHLAQLAAARQTAHSQSESQSDSRAI